MSFKRKVSDELKKSLRILKRKDRVTFLAVDRKMHQIAGQDRISIDHFKNLKGNMSHLRRVQIGSFVLRFKVNGDTIIFESFRHHDKAYKR